MADDKQDLEDLEIDGVDDIDIDLVDIGTIIDPEKYREKPTSDKPEDEPEEEEEVEEETDDSEGELGDDKSKELTDEEKKRLGKRAQRRIQQLVKRAKDAEARAQELESKYGEASEKASTFEKQASDNRKQLIAELENRLLAQESEAKSALRKAKIDGDLDAEIDATDQLAEVKANQLMLANAKREVEAEVTVDDEERETPSKPKAKEKPEEREKEQRPDRDAMRWMRNNSWFNGETNKHRIMTNWAIEIHRDLIQEGIVPTPGDAEAIKEYYDELDYRIREEFPEEFESKKDNKDTEERPARPANPVSTGGTRTTGRSKGKNEVKLTRSEMAMADRTGVSYEEYAREKAKIASRN